jgi:hypothetical protein
LEDLNKEDRILKEIKRLNSIFNKVDKNKIKTVKSLIENAAFMTVTLEDLQKLINAEEGLISKYKNGENQYGTKKSPEVEIYNTMIKNFSTIIKQLTDLAPEGKSSGKTNELLKYVSGGAK